MKVGIAYDNYKVDKFKEALDKEKHIYYLAPMKNDLTLITVIIEENQLNDIFLICERLEIKINQDKSKNN